MTAKQLAFSIAVLFYLVSIVLGEECSQPESFLNYNSQFAKVRTMSKSNVPSNVNFVDYSEIHWNQLHTRDGRFVSTVNTRPTSYDNPFSDLFTKGSTPKPTGDGLVVPMSRGWDLVQGIPQVYELDSAEQKEAVQQRIAQVNEWLNHESKVFHDLARTAEKVWGLVSEKTGKPLKNPPMPKYGGNMAFRRALGVMGAIHVLNYEAEDEPNFAYTIPVVVTEYESEVDAIVAHVRENDAKDEGRSKYSPLDYLEIARRILGAGGRESHLTRAGVKRGTAQRAWAFAKLDRKFGKLKLIQRALLDPPVLKERQTRYPYSEGCYIPMSVLKTNELRWLAQGRQATKTDSEILPATKADEVESYICKAMKGSTNSKKVMSGTDIKNLAENHDCEIVRLVAWAIQESHQRTLDKLRKAAEQLNDATLPIIESMMPKVLARTDDSSEGSDS